MSRWGYENLATMNELLNAGRDKRRLVATALLFALLFVLTLFAADRIRRQRNRTRVAIAERDRAEKERCESERRFRDLLENAQLVAIIIDLNSGVSFCNDYALSITGWTREEVIVRDAKEILDPEYLLEVRKVIQGSEAGTQILLPFSEGPLLAKERRAALDSMDWHGSARRHRSHNGLCRSRRRHYRTKTTENGSGDSRKRGTVQRNLSARRCRRRSS
jgi:PAS domain-containing protein